MRSSRVKDIMRDIERKLERAVDHFFVLLNRDSKQITPIRTGRAKAGFRKTGKYRLGDTGVIIENLVPYIGLLDQGSSRQAPDGIVQPTLDKMLKRRNKL